MKIETAVFSAHGVTDIFLKEAIADIDKRLGQGYAEQHPELISAFIQCCTWNLVGSIMAGMVD